MNVLIELMEEARVLGCLNLVDEIFCNIEGLDIYEDFSYFIEAIIGELIEDYEKA